MFYTLHHIFPLQYAIQIGLMLPPKQVIGYHEDQELNEVYPKFSFSSRYYTNRVKVLYHFMCNTLLNASSSSWGLILPRNFLIPRPIKNLMEFFFLPETIPSIMAGLFSSLII